MSFAVAVAAVLAGGAGALARHFTVVGVAARAGSDFPFGTLTVNLSGSLLLGLLLGAGVGGDALLVAGGGALGSYTTFSAWMADSDGLAREGRAPAAALNLAGSLILGLLALLAGRAIGGWL
ncbi:MAG: fluoride efflux transporter CrcB [Solirubrobacteraceae bacterium]|nr:fluoride efflux transporter CrcB [Solirubrobacteraceae bacterium]